MTVGIINSDESVMMIILQNVVVFVYKLTHNDVI